MTIFRTDNGVWMVQAEALTVEEAESILRSCKPFEEELREYAHAKANGCPVAFLTHYARKHEDKYNQTWIAY